MKSLIVYLVCIILMTTTLWADEIYLKNGRVITCTIIQVTDDTIEYDPQGDIPFEVLAKTQAEKAVFADGRVMFFTVRKTLMDVKAGTKKNRLKKNINYDEIYLKSGIIVAGNIIKITKDYIQYDPPGSRMDDIILRDQVYQVQFRDGRVMKLN